MANNGSKAYKTIYQTFTTLNKTLEEFLKDMLVREKMKSQHETIEKLAESVKNTGELGQVYVSPKTYNHLVPILKASDIPYRAENIGNKKEICLFFSVEKIKEMELAIEKAENKCVKNNGEPIAAKDFYTYSYNESVITINNIDNYWLYNFKKYAEKFNLNYCAEEITEDKYRLSALESDKEKFNKAIFCTQWDMSSKYKSLYEALAYADMNKKEYYDMQIEEVAKNGGVVLTSNANMNDKLIITKDGYERIIGNTVIEQGNVNEIGYKTKLEANREDFGSHRQYTLVSLQGYKKAKNKLEYIANEGRIQNRVNITKKQAERLRASKLIRDYILAHKDFSKSASYTNVEYQSIYSDLEGFYNQAKQVRDATQYDINKAIGNGALISNAKDIEIAAANVIASLKELKELVSESQTIVVDETLLQFNDISRAKELYTAKVYERSLEKENRELDNILSAIGIEPNSISVDFNEVENEVEEEISGKANEEKEFEGFDSFNVSDMNYLFKNEELVQGEEPKMDEPML